MIIYDNSGRVCFLDYISTFYCKGLCTPMVKWRKHQWTQRAVLNDREIVHGPRELWSATRRPSMDPVSCAQRQGDCPWTQRTVLSNKETGHGPRELYPATRRLFMDPESCTQRQGDCPWTQRAVLSDEDCPWTQRAVLSDKETVYGPRELCSIIKRLSMNPERCAQ